MELSASDLGILLNYSDCVRYGKDNRNSVVEAKHDGHARDIGT